MEIESINPKRIRKAGKSFLVSFILSVLCAGITGYLSTLGNAIGPKWIIPIIFVIGSAGSFVSGCVELIKCTEEHKF